MGFDEVMRYYLSAEELERIGRVIVGIAGAGGLGSNCAACLARCGFSKFVIADGDRVELSNLNRQAYFADQVGMPKVTALRDNLLRISPAAQIRVVQSLLGRDNIVEVFADCDVVVEAFDSAECKAMIAEALVPRGTFVVSASGLAGIGRSDEIGVHRVRDNFHVVGDLESAATEARKPFAPRVTVAAAKEADLVLEWTLNGYVDLRDTDDVIANGP